MSFMKWAAVAAAVAGMALVSGCGGNSGSNANIRLVNASSGYSSLDLAVNGNTVDTGVAYGAAGNYASVSVNATTSQLSNAGNTVLAPNLTMTGGDSYSMIAYGWQGAVRYSLLQENQTAPVAGQSSLLVLNLAPDAGPLDVYATATCSTSLTNATPLAPNVAGGNGSGYIPTAAGTYCLQVTGAQLPNDLRLQIPNVSLPSLQVATLVLTATPGGVLVNGIFVIQAGTVTNYPGTNARVRLVNTMAGATGVAQGVWNQGAANAVALLPAAQLSPAIGLYNTVPAGNHPITVNVNGVDQAPQQTTMAAGGDYTLLVWGNATAPQYSLIADDNRLPTTAGTAKIRLYNGLANMAANTSLTMTLNFVAVANNVLPGTSSAPYVATANAINSTGSTLRVTSSAFGSTNLIDVGTGNLVPIGSGTVNEVFMSGDGSTVSGIQGVFNPLR